MGRILIVEDEDKIARFIELELTHEGYEVDKAADGRAGVEAALANPYDLILLDVVLPQLNGIEVLRRVRRVKSTPVILLTARDAVMDKVAGLDAGADDYITKPFAIEELLARVRVALKHGPTGGGAGAGGPGVAGPSARQAAGPGAGEPGRQTGLDATPAGMGGVRPAAASDAGAGEPTRGGAGGGTLPGRGVHVVGRVRLDEGRHEVSVEVPQAGGASAGGAGEPGDARPGCAAERVELTNREFAVLRALMAHRNLVMTREQLVREACDYDYLGETNIIDVYVRHIRAKIDDRFGIELISTVRGVGYVVRED